MKTSLRPLFLSVAIALGLTVTLAVFAQEQPAPAPAPAAETIQSITVVGMQRLEPDTIRSYIRLRFGQPYSQVAADQALKDLFATELFSDVQVRNDGGNVVIGAINLPVAKMPV